MSSIRVFKDRGTWRARITFDTDAFTGERARRQRSFPEAHSEREARELAESWAAEVGGDTVGSMLMEYAEHVALTGTGKGHGARANTAHAYATRARRLAKVLPPRPANEINELDVMQAERRLLADGLSPSSVNACHQFMSSAFSWARKVKIVDHNPVAGIDHPKEPRSRAEDKVYSAGEGARIAAWCRARLADPEVKGDGREAALAILVMLGTGMRIGEALALRVQDFRPEVPDLLVCATVTDRGGLRRQPAPKQGDHRTVAIAPPLAALIEAHAEGKDPREPICGRRKLLSTATVRRALRACCAELGIAYRPPHALRHTHATILLAQGASVGAVQRRLGHARAATTLDIYAHAVPAEDAALARGMEDALARARRP